MEVTVIVLFLYCCFISYIIGFPLLLRANIIKIEISLQYTVLNIIINYNLLSFIFLQL